MTSNDVTSASSADTPEWLYTRHFGLHEAPFTLTPDTRFYYPHSSSQIVLNTLIVAVRSGEGFTKITGEVGTGKTLLCRMLMDVLDRDHILAYIPNPYLEPMTLLLAIADELGISYPDGINQHQLLKALTRFIIEGYAWDKRSVVVCLDEAHAMPRETLETLRLLSNLETGRRKLIQLVLFGQPELDDKLNQPGLRQLKQRISFSCTLSPLRHDDVRHYLEHRLHMAGFKGELPFRPEAVKRLARASGGILRLLNILAHKAMMSAYGTGEHSINGRHIKQAIADTEAIQSSRHGHTLPAMLAALLTSAATRLQRVQR